MTELIWEASAEASDIDVAEQALPAYDAADEIEPFIDDVSPTADADLADLIEQRHDVPLVRLL
jgi:hypothetical protein